MLYFKNVFCYILKCYILASFVSDVTSTLQVGVTYETDYAVLELKTKCRIHRLKHLGIYFMLRKYFPYLDLAVVAICKCSKCYECPTRGY